MDLNEFVQTYFGLLAKRLPQYDPKAVIAAVWQGTRAMTANDGTMTNEDRFWSVFADCLGDAEIVREKPNLEDFYRTDFHKVKAICGENPLAKPIVDLAHHRAETVVLATNPLFPACAVESRLQWIGLTPADFDYITTYEVCSSCKPTESYYRAICRTLELEPTEVLMVGNDLREDGLGASRLGMSVHIVTDSLITHDLNLEDYPHSTFAELERYL